MTEQIKPGKQIRAWMFEYAKVYKIHILAIIEEKMVVYKYFGKHKQWWHYEIEHIDKVELMIIRAGSDA